MFSNTWKREFSRVHSGTQGLFLLPALSLQACSNWLEQESEAFLSKLLQKMLRFPHRRHSSIFLWQWKLGGFLLFCVGLECHSPSLNVAFVQARELSFLELQSEHWFLWIKFSPLLFLALKDSLFLFHFTVLLWSFTCLHKHNSSDSCNVSYILQTLCIFM